MIINFDSDRHSTQQAIITLFDNITKSLDNGNIAISIFIDLKKAFDTVDDRILRKLYAYDIRGPMLKWIESYLINWKNPVCYF